MLTLSTPRLNLRPIRRRDVAAIGAILNDWAVARMLCDVPFPCSLEATERWIRRGLDEQAFAVVESDQVIGAVTYFDCGSAAAEIGFVIRRDHWGHGFAGEAAAHVIAHAAKSDHIAEFHSRHVIDNVASRRVLEKLGFEPAGRDVAYLDSRQREVPVLTYRLASGDALALTAASKANFAPTLALMPKAIRRMAWRMGTDWPVRRV